MQENNSPQTKGVDHKQTPTEATGDKSKLPRHPRWTIQDTFVLIQAKQVAEQRGPKGLVFGSESFEPKWDFVSSFCKQHGVDRGPVQCRKRWSNLICEFRKVKTWESQVRNGEKIKAREEGESYWTMRTELRREKKLPGFFDKEIYDMLDGESLAVTAYPLRTVSDDSTDVEDEEQCGNALENNTLILNENGSILESNALIINENGIVLENNTLMLEEDISLPYVNENEDKEACAGNSTSKSSPTPVTTKEKSPSTGYCEEPITQKGRKRKQTSSNGYEDTSLKKLLTEALEKNFMMMNAQLEAQSLNSQLDREQQKELSGNLVDALAKIADSLGRIADKL